MPFAHIQYLVRRATKDELQAHYQLTDFLLSGKIASGIPKFHPPFLDYEDEHHKLKFIDGLATLWPAAMVVPLVSILSTVSVAKAFSKYFNIEHAYVFKLKHTFTHICKHSK